MENVKKQYIMYMLKDGVVGKDGVSLEPGFYRCTYSLGDGFDGKCQYSKDRYEWVDWREFSDLCAFQDFFDELSPTPMKIEREEYIETIFHRGICVPVFLDDYGQCFYAILDNEVISFGSFQDGYEDEIRDLIDMKLDREKSGSCEVF